MYLQIFIYLCSVIDCLASWQVTTAKNKTILLNVIWLSFMTSTDGDVTMQSCPYNVSGITSLNHVWHMGALDSIHKGILKPHTCGYCWLEAGGPLTQLAYCYIYLLYFYTRDTRALRCTTCYLFKYIIHNFHQRR